MIGDGDAEVKSKLRPSSDKLFSEVQATYSVLAGTILGHWCDCTAQEFNTALSAQGYLKRKWFSSQEFEDPGTAQTPQIVLPIHNLRTAVESLYAGMDSSLAEEWLEALALKLDKVRYSFVLIRSPVLGRVT